MPLHHVVVLVKKGVKKRNVVDLLSNLGQRVCDTRGVCTDVKAFGLVNPAHPLRKLDGRQHQVRLLSRQAEILNAPVSKGLNLLVWYMLFICQQNLQWTPSWGLGQIDPWSDTGYQFFHYVSFQSRYRITHSGKGILYKICLTQ
jgi:hypothetical protein